MFVLLFALFCAVCIAALFSSIRIIQHVRDTHPLIWRRLGIPGNGWWVKAKDEATAFVAQKRFRSFLNSPERLALHDKYLNKLVSVSRALNYLASGLFVVVILVWAHMQKLF